MFNPLTGLAAMGGTLAGLGLGLAAGAALAVAAHGAMAMETKR